MTLVYCCHYCMFSLTEKPEQKWPRCSLYLPLPTLPPVAPCTRAFFPWRPVRKCLFPCCCLAFLWRPIGMRSLVAAVCKNRKQSRQQGVKQIHMTPNSVFSLFISPASFLLPSLSFILPHTHRIRGLCHVLGKRVLLLLTKARNSSIWPSLLAVPPSPLPLLLPAVLPRHSPTSIYIFIYIYSCMLYTLQNTYSIIDLN